MNTDRGAGFLIIILLLILIPSVRLEGIKIKITSKIKRGGACR
jgi:hypothetical protein